LISICTFKTSTAHLYSQNKYSSAADKNDRPSWTATAVPDWVKNKKRFILSYLNFKTLGQMNASRLFFFMVLLLTVATDPGGNMCLCCVACLAYLLDDMILVGIIAAMFPPLLPVLLLLLMSADMTLCAVSCMICINKTEMLSSALHGTIGVGVPLGDHNQSSTHA